MRCRYSVMRLLIVYYGECLWSSLELQHNWVQFPSPRLEGGLCPQVSSSLRTRHRDQDLRERRGVHQTLKSQSWNYWPVVTSIYLIHPYALASSYPNVFNSNVSATLDQSSSGHTKLLSSSRARLSHGESLARETSSNQQILQGYTEYAAKRCFFALVSWTRPSLTILQKRWVRDGLAMATCYQCEPLPLTYMCTFSGYYILWVS